MPYLNSIQHLNDYSQIIQIYLHEYIEGVVKTSAVTDTPFEKYKGLVISIDEINDKFSSRDFFLPKASADRIFNLYTKINSEAPESLPLERLCRAFKLSMFERFALVLAVMPYIDSSYEKIYGYINDNVNQKFPTLTLALKLFVENNLSSVLNGNLFKYIIEPVDNPLSGEMKLNKRTVDFLLDGELYKRYPFLYTVGEKRDEKLILHPDKIDAVKKTINSPNRLCIILSGESGAGRKFIASSAAPITVVDIDKLNYEEFRTASNTVLREIILRGGLPFLSIVKNENARLLNLIIEKLEEVCAKIFVSIDTGTDIELKSSFDVYYINVPELTRSQRFEFWKSTGIFPKASLYHSVSNKYKFTPEKIIKASNYVKNISHAEEISITEAVLDRCCNIFSQNAMGKRAQIVESHFTFDDLVLPEKEKRQIREGINHIKYRHVVYDTWGFEEKLAYGKGLVMLFSGPSGTGKTMAATIVAGELGLTAYRVDISGVMSKYIGETEKNLGEIFDIAQRNNIVLFFDECDALFGKRSEINDSHDKYANVETSFLLQRLESFDGIVLMSTNLLQNIDDAFLRRISYVINFPFPDYQQRLIIWQKVFPDAMPKSNGIDYEYLSRQFELSGAMIKNAVMSAAFLAAESDSEINMGHILRSIAGQLQKQGKVLLKEDFGKYFALIE